MGFRIDEPVGRQMQYLSQEQKELLMAQRHFENARLTGDFNPLDMIHLGLLDAAIAAGSDDATAIKTALENPTPHCDCKAEIGKNYQTKYKVWTERSKGIETAYRCFLCGHWLVSDAPPDELSATVNNIRANTDSALSPLLKTQAKRHQVRVFPEGLPSDSHKSLR